MASTNPVAYGLGNTDTKQKRWTRTQSYELEKFTCQPRRGSFFKTESWFRQGKAATGKVAVFMIEA